MLLVVALNSLSLTNRVFGPLVRLRRVLRLWREGEAWPPQLRVRPRDFHAPLFEDFNATAAALRAELEEARVRLRGAEERARELAHRLEAGPEADEARLVEGDCREALVRLARLARRDPREG